jgi:hypothetical protein
MRNFLKFAIVFTLFLTAVFGFSKFASAASASLYLSPAAGTYGVGSSFTVKILLDSGGAPGVNAADGIVSFDNSVLSASVLKDNSIFNLWTTEPKVSGGTINFSGGLTPPAFARSGGLVATVTFKAIKEGTVKVNFSGAQVLAADGQGTNILVSPPPGANYTVTAGTPAPKPSVPPPIVQPTVSGDSLPPPEVSSATHPDPNKWYAAKDAKFTWKVPSGVWAVRMLANNSATSTPTIVASPPVAEKELKDLSDGVWYFHIQFRNDAGWGEINHRKFLIDTKPPKINRFLVEQKDPTDQRPILVFETTDEVSGIDRFEVKVGDEVVATVTAKELAASPAKPTEKSAEYAANIGSAGQLDQTTEFSYQLPAQKPGQYTLKLVAYDAGNNTAEAIQSLTVQQAAEQTQVGAFSMGSGTTVLLIIVIIGLCAAAYFAFYERKILAMIRTATRAKIEKVEEDTGEIYQALKEEVEEQVNTFDKKQTLSETEKEVAGRINEAIDVSEKVVKEELEGIKKDFEDKGR